MNFDCNEVVNCNTIFFQKFCSIFDKYLNFANIVSKSFRLIDIKYKMFTKVLQIYA